MPSLGKSLGTKWKFKQCCRLWITILYCWMHRQGWWLCWKKGQIFIKIKSGSDAYEGENLKVLYMMNLVSLVIFENFEWWLMTPAAVICNNCNFTKQYWSNILSNEFLGGDIWTLLAILSCVKCQWKVCYNKLKQGNFQKNWYWRWKPRYLWRTCSLQWSY